MGSSRDALFDSLHTNLSIYKENLKLIAGRVIDSLYAEHMRPETIRPVIGKVVSESYKGPCEDIVELEEDMYSSMYNSAVMQQHEKQKELDFQIKEPHLGESAVISMKGDNEIFIDDMGLSQESTPVDLRSINNIDEYNDISDSAKDEKKSTSATADKRPYNSYADNNIRVQVESPSKSVTELKRMTRLQHNYASIDEMTSQAITERTRTNKNTIQNSLRRLADTVILKRHARNRSYQPNKFLKSQLNISSQSFIKKQKTATIADIKRSIPPYSFKTINKERYSDRKHTTYTNDSGVKTMLAEITRREKIKNSGSTRSLDWAEDGCEN